MNRPYEDKAMDNADRLCKRRGHMKGRYCWPGGCNFTEDPATRPLCPRCNESVEPGWTRCCRKCALESPNYD